MKNWGDFKQAYYAGADAYRKKSRWSDWAFPITVIPVVTAAVCRRHGVAWTDTLVAMVVITVLLTVLLAVWRRTMRR